MESDGWPERLRTAMNYLCYIPVAPRRGPKSDGSSSLKMRLFSVDNTSAALGSVSSAGTIRVPSGSS